MNNDGTWRQNEQFAYTTVFGASTRHPHLPHTCMHSSGVDEGVHIMYRYPFFCQYEIDIYVYVWSKELVFCFWLSESLVHVYVQLKYTIAIYVNKYRAGKKIIDEEI